MEGSAKRRKGYRLINAAGTTWQWGMGNLYITAIRIDGQKRIRITISKLMGLTPDEVDRGRYKKWLHITPTYVADWINKTA